MSPLLADSHAWKAFASATRQLVTYPEKLRLERAVADAAINFSAIQARSDEIWRKGSPLIDCSALDDNGVFKYREKKETIVQAMGLGSPKEENIVIITAHDDDPTLALCNFLKALTIEGYNVQVLVATDGCMGFGSDEEGKSIVTVRQKAAFYGYMALGIAPENLHFMGFPDGDTARDIGARKAGLLEQLYDPRVINGMIGMQISSAHYCRQLKATRVIITCPEAHPDHQNVSIGFGWGVVQAQESMWYGLGDPTKVCRFYEFGVRRILETTEGSIRMFHPYGNELVDLAMSVFNETQAKLIEHVTTAREQLYRFIDGEYPASCFNQIRPVVFNQGPTMKDWLEARSIRRE